MFAKAALLAVLIILDSQTCEGGWKSSGQGSIVSKFTSNPTFLRAFHNHEYYDSSQGYYAEDSPDVYVYHSHSDEESDDDDHDVEFGQVVEVKDHAAKKTTEDKELRDFLKTLPPFFSPHRFERKPAGFSIAPPDHEEDEEGDGDHKWDEYEDYEGEEPNFKSLPHYKPPEPFQKVAKKPGKLIEGEKNDYEEYGYEEPGIKIHSQHVNVGSSQIDSTNPLDNSDSSIDSCGPNIQCGKKEGEDEYELVEDDSFKALPHYSTTKPFKANPDNLAGGNTIPKKEEKNKTIGENETNVGKPQLQILPQQGTPEPFHKIFNSSEGNISGKVESNINQGEGEQYDFKALPHFGTPSPFQEKSANPLGNGNVTTGETKKEISKEVGHTTGASKVYGVPEPFQNINSSRSEERKINQGEDMSKSPPQLKSLVHIQKNLKNSTGNNSSLRREEPRINDEIKIRTEEKQLQVSQRYGLPESSLKVPKNIEEIRNGSIEEQKKRQFEQNHSIGLPNNGSPEPFQKTIKKKFEDDGSKVIPHYGRFKYITKKPAEYSNITPEPEKTSGSQDIAKQSTFQALPNYEILKRFTGFLRAPKMKQEQVNNPKQNVPKKGDDRNVNKYINAGDGISVFRSLPQYEFHEFLTKDIGANGENKQQLGSNEKQGSNSKEQNINEQHVAFKILPNYGTPQQFKSKSSKEDSSQEITLPAKEEDSQQAESQDSFYSFQQLPFYDVLHSFKGKKKAKIPEEIQSSSIGKEHKNTPENTDEHEDQEEKLSDFLKELPHFQIHSVYREETGEIFREGISHGEEIGGIKEIQNLSLHKIRPLFDHPNENVEQEISEQSTSHPDFPALVKDPSFPSHHTEEEVESEDPAAINGTAIFIFKSLPHYTVLRKFKTPTGDVEVLKPKVEYVKKVTVRTRPKKFRRPPPIITHYTLKHRKHQRKQQQQLPKKKFVPRRNKTGLPDIERKAVFRLIPIFEHDLATLNARDRETLLRGGLEDFVSFGKKIKKVTVDKENGTIADLPLEPFNSVGDVDSYGHKIRKHR